MLTLTGNGRLTRDVALRATHSGKTVATGPGRHHRRDRHADPVDADLIVWRPRPRPPPTTSSRARPSAPPDASSRAPT